MGCSIKFTKMEGIGNDYVYINCFTEQVPNPRQLAIEISNRHFGAGSDGLVLILPSKIADLKMRMFNADGSEAEMCGNASRCVGKFAYDNNLISGDTFTLETGAGIKVIKLRFDNGNVVGATVDMGEPILRPELIPVNLCHNQERCVAEIINVDGKQYEITAVSMGNPHAVLFVKDIETLNLPELGPEFENHPVFPKRVNTEFIEVISRNHIKMRVWERGAGETLACGTGACAALVACVLNNLTDNEAVVELLGGNLHIAWDKASNHILMTGPARTVFYGEYLLNRDSIKQDTPCE